MKTRLLQAALLAGALCAGCLFQPEDRVAGGGSSETTNGIVVGMVSNADGTPAAGSRVLLRPRDYLKGPGTALAKAARLSAETVTDSAGHFALDSVSPGDYLLEANDSGKAGALFEFSTDSTDSVILAPKPMKPTAVITGTVTTGTGKLSDAYVQIYGLDRLVRVDSTTGRFAVTDLPEGTYTLRALLTTTVADPRVVPGIEAKSGDTVDVGTLELASFQGEDYTTWAYSRQIILNTTASGANVKNNVTNFPLLIRLNAGNFNFTQSDGSDLRFADRNGKRLRYQVERWDALNQQAEVWVQIDTVHGNSRSDLVTMYWGMPGAPDWSDGRQVFDTADGYGGVWHLSEEAPDTVTDGLYQDATAAAQHGDDFILATNTDGLIGLGHAFNFGDRIRITPSASLRPSKYLFVSGWFQGKTTDKDGATIAGLGDSYGLRVEPSGNVRFFYFKGPGSVWNVTETKGVNVLDSAWHQVAGVFTGSDLQVYVDGEEKAHLSVSDPVKYTLGPDFYIGRHGNGKTNFDLKGQLDEVTVINRTRGPYYIKLCFESQRVNPTLLEFQP